MSGPLLSRFDLVYLLLDAADEGRDRTLSEHVMALHSGALAHLIAAICQRLMGWVV